MCFANRIISFDFENNALDDYNAGVVVVNWEAVGLAQGVNFVEQFRP
jgi:hypothetical protein